MVHQGPRRSATPPHPPRQTWGCMGEGGKAAWQVGRGRCGAAHELLPCCWAPRMAQPWAAHRRGRSSRSGTRLPAGPCVSMVGRPAVWRGGERPTWMRPRSRIDTMFQGASKLRQLPQPWPCNYPPNVRSASCKQGEGQELACERAGSTGALGWAPQASGRRRAATAVVKPGRTACLVDVPWAGWTLSAHIHTRLPLPGRTGDQKGVEATLLP